MDTIYVKINIKIEKNIYDLFCKLTHEFCVQQINCDKKYKWKINKFIKLGIINKEDMNEITQYQYENEYQFGTIERDILNYEYIVYNNNNKMLFN